MASWQIEDLKTGKKTKVGPIPPANLMEGTRATYMDVVRADYEKKAGIIWFKENGAEGCATTKNIKGFWSHEIMAWGTDLEMVKHVAKMLYQKLGLFQAIGDVFSSAKPRTFGQKLGDLFKKNN